MSLGAGTFRGVRLRRLLAILLLIAFAVGLSQDLLRRGDDYIAHVICPEHGELIHAFAPNPPGERAIMALPTSRHSDGCELAVLGPWPTPARPAAQITLPELQGRDLPPSVDAPTLDRREPRVLGYAPKTSPPVV